MSESYHVNRSQQFTIGDFCFLVTFTEVYFLFLCAYHNHLDMNINESDTIDTKTTCFRKRQVVKQIRCIAFEHSIAMIEYIFHLCINTYDKFRPFTKYLDPSGFFGAIHLNFFALAAEL